MEIIGWLGSILLAFCGLPQAIESYKTKSSEGLTWGFLFMWFMGEIFTIIYILPQMVLPLLFNYTANVIFLSIIIYYKINPKK
jgi:MtN3 and saliva related transmembrane protein